MTDAELREYTEFADELPGGQRSAILRLVAEVERLRKNSERWEWCRKRMVGERWGKDFVHVKFSIGVGHGTIEAAVDAAIAAEKVTE